MGIKIIGKADGCGTWELTESGNGYRLTHRGTYSEFDNLRLPLELMYKTAGAMPWKDTLIEAVKVVDERNGIYHDGIESWSRQELIDYLISYSKQQEENE